MKDFEDMGFCKVDIGREARTGHPEVIFGQGKTVPQVRAIFGRLMEAHGRAMVTRATPEMAAAVKADYSDATYDPVSRLLTCGRATPSIPGQGVCLVRGDGRSAGGGRSGGHGGVDGLSGGADLRRGCRRY